MEAYLGLQYGSLLGGELRFMPPTAPTETWGEAIKDASRFHPICPQPNGEMMVARASSAEMRDKWMVMTPYLEHQAEECLRLNVYVPVSDTGGGVASKRDQSEGLEYTFILKNLFISICLIIF